MKNILTIFKKEWDRVIKDKRLVITVMLLPGLMIFMIYTFIGTAMQNMVTEESYKIAIVNNQDEIKTVLDSFNNNPDAEYSIDYIRIDFESIDIYKTKIDDGEWDLLVVFSEGIDTYDGTGDKPTIYLYHNPNEIASSTIYSDMYNIFVEYENAKSLELYGDRTYLDFVYDSSPLDENGFVGRLIGSLIPMLIIMFLFSGAMSIGPESIAGEKERGTIATLLVTPVKRHEIAIGKISALSVLTLISATSSFIGIIFSLPKMMSFDEVNANIYELNDYILILVVLFSTVFIIVGIISIISAYAKNLKEASTFIMPIYILTILVSITSMFGEGANENLVLYLLPIYNSVQTLTAILTSDPNVYTYLIFTVGANLVYLAVFIFILNRMFNSEKVMFAK